LRSVYVVFPTKVSVLKFNNTAFIPEEFRVPWASF